MRPTVEDNPVVDPQNVALVQLDKPSAMVAEDHSVKLPDDLVRLGRGRFDRVLIVDTVSYRVASAIEFDDRLRHARLAPSLRPMKDESRPSQFSQVLFR